MSDAPGRERIGKYPVIKLLGSGATSEVYLCHDPFNGRDVAVKVVSTDMFDDPVQGKLFKKLFVNEASLAGKLQHPHIVQIYDAVADEKLHYIVMEYVDGGTLEKFCVPESLLPIETVVEMAFKCTRALETAHRMGITHRDIKPANILHAGGSEVKITDFTRRWSPRPRRRRSPPSARRPTCRRSRSRSIRWTTAPTSTRWAW